MTFILINILIALSIRKNFLSSILFALFFGTTYQIGQFDWSSYENLYQLIKNRSFTEALAINTIGHYEPIFSIFIIILSRVISEYWIAKTIIYFLGFFYFSRSLSISQIHSKELFTFIFLSLTSYTIFYTADRQAIAFLLVIGAYLQHKKSLISIGFHYSSVIIYLMSLRFKTYVTFLPILLLAMYYMFSKYLYLLNIGQPSLTSIMITSSILLLTLTTRQKKNLIFLFTLFTLAFALMFFPAVFYRVKVYVICMLLIYVFQNWRRNLANPLIVTATLTLSLLINVVYVASDALAFGQYQTHLLKPYVTYRDKTNLWYSRFELENG